MCPPSEGPHYSLQEAPSTSTPPQRHCDTCQNAEPSATANNHTVDKEEERKKASFPRQISAGVLSSRGGVYPSPLTPSQAQRRGGVEVERRGESAAEGLASASSRAEAFHLH